MNMTLIQKVIIGSVVGGFNKINISYNDAYALLIIETLYDGIITEEPENTFKVI